MKPWSLHDGTSLQRRRLVRVLAVAWLILVGLSLQPGRAAEDAKKEADEAPAKRIGRTIKLNLPITGQTFIRVRRYVRRAMENARQENQRPVFIFEFAILSGQDEFGRGSQFGGAYDLADFLSGEELNAASTAAYLPDSIQGHAVLVALACDEIIMAPQATIGSAGIDSKVINETMLRAYREIAGRRKTFPAAVALALLDPDREVLEVKTEVSTEYITPAELEELKKRRTIEATSVLIPVGQSELTGSEARQRGFVSYLASSRQDVAKALELPPEDIEVDASLGDEWRAVRIDLKGPITADKASQVQRLIEDAVQKRDINFVCLWIESPGGSPSDSLRLANFLAFDLDPGEVRTVAYIASEARADASIVALACDQVVMHPSAIMGGSGAYELSKDEIEEVRIRIQEVLAPRKSRSWSLPAAMLDPDLEVYRATHVTRVGDVEYFSDDELSEQPKPDEWRKGKPVTKPGLPFRVQGEKAREYRLAYDTAEGFEQFKELYGLQDDPALVEPGWADFLIEALGSPGVAGLLLLIGFAALYAELQAPGMGIGGFTAAVCFLLFFWSRYLGGTAGWLEATLFLAGISCLLLEVFVLPGFGVFGLGGGMLVLASLILASQTFIIPQNAYQFAQLRRSLLIITGAGVGLFAAVAMMRRWLPSTPILSQMMLQPPSGEEAEAIRHHETLGDFGDLVGCRGVTTTQLTPGGKARFDDRLVNVIADGEVIPSGTEIQVVAVHGNRVLVQQV